MPNENLCRAMKRCNSRATKWLNRVSIISVVGKTIVEIIGSLSTAVSDEKLTSGEELMGSPLKKQSLQFK